MTVKKVPSGKSVNSSRNPKQMSSAKIQAALYQIADAASAVTDMQSFYKRLHEIVGTLMYAENFFIALHDPQTDLITWPYYVDTVDIEQPEPIALKEQHGGTGWILRTGRTLSHAEGTVSYIIEHGEAEQTGTVSDAIGVPLNSDGKTVGVLLIQSYRDEVKYNLKHVEIMNFVAQHISIALTRARAIEETRQRNSELAIINSVQAALAAQLDIHGIYKAVGEKLREIFNYQDAGIYSADLKTRTVTIEYAFEKGRKFERISVPMNSLYEYILAANRTFVFNGNVAEFSAQFEDYKVPVGELPKSGVFVPVPRKKEAGLSVYLILEDVDGTRFFSASDVRLLETLANAMSVALENARLFDETQQRNAELAILNSVGEAMAKTLDVKTVTRIVGDKVRDIFSADQIGILLFEQPTNLIHLVYGYDKAHDRYVDDIQIKPIPLGQGLTSRVIESRQPLLLSTHEEQNAHGHYLPPELKGQIKTSESWLGVPIMVGEDVLGVVMVEDYRPHMYNETHLRLLQTLSSNMGVAIQNARLFDETQQRNAELAIINSVQEGLASKLEMQGIYDLVGDKLREIFGAGDVIINMYDEGRELISAPYVSYQGKQVPASISEWMPLSNAPMREYLIRIGKPLVVNRNYEQWAEQFQTAPPRDDMGWPKSSVNIPIVIADKVTGLIWLNNYEREDTYTESDLRLLSTLASGMGVALENARLWEQERMFRKALQRELDIGREIQAGFLPETLPRVEGWEIAASLMSAREVAGDFYDAFELPDGNIGLVIADVCDKGVGAALFMTLFRSLIRAAANLDYFEQTEKSDAPHSAKERLQRAISLTNNYIAETHGESGMFATLFFGILDPRDGKLVYVNGGHESPLMVQSGTVRETLRRTGPAVGVLANARFDILETQMQPGEAFFAFTDGVPDCQNPRGEFFGRERLLDSLQRRSESAPELVAAMESELRQYIASANQFDDITLLAVKRN